MAAAGGRRAPRGHGVAEWGPARCGSRLGKSADGRGWFKDGTGSEVDFYGNPKIDDLAFNDNFVLTLQVSDEPSSSDAGNKAAQFATQSGSVSASELPAPGYTVGYGGFTVDKDVDNRVVGVSGVAALTDAGVDGQHYQVVIGAFDSSSTIDAVEAAFTSPALLSGLTNLEIPASQFLATVDLSPEIVSLNHAVAHRFPTRRGTLHDLGGCRERVFPEGARF